MGQAVSGVSGFADLIDLVSSRLGGRAVACSDDFFASMDNLVTPERAVFIPGKFTERGKWMDGWESRRKRVPGHDWCVLALGRPGIIRGVNVDTGCFKGNQPEACTLEAAELPEGAGDADALAPGVRWVDVIPRTVLAPDSEHLIEAIAAVKDRRFTHVRLNIFPDGGVARLRVHGEVLPDWEAIRRKGDPVDLASAANGGLVIACNDMHFGSRHNLITPGRAANMGDGWETRRKRGLKGGEYDWCVVRLGRRGVVSKVEVDTNHFKGNFPESCAIEAWDGVSEPVGNQLSAEAGWKPLLARTKLAADTRHFFEKELSGGGKGVECTHVRLRIFPDGGVSRLRLHGVPA